MSQQINDHRILAFKIGSGAFQIPNSNGSTRYVRLTGGFNLGNGIPDCICSYKGSDGIGKMFWIEFKLPGKPLSDNQKYVAKMFIDLKIPMFVCRTFEDLQRIVETVKAIDKKDTLAVLEMINKLNIETEFDIFKPKRKRQRKWTLPEGK